MPVTDSSIMTAMVIKHALLKESFNILTFTRKANMCQLLHPRWSLVEYGNPETSFKFVPDRRKANEYC